MLSLFIMYSNDRKRSLAYTLSCLEDMDLYHKCQKTLVVDGSCDSIPDGWRPIFVPRIAGKFSWANMWMAGVGTARHDVVVYMDCDRLLPTTFLQGVVDNVADDVFVFTSRHFQLLDYPSVEDCKRILNRSEFDDSQLFLDPAFFGKIDYEPRFSAPLHGPGKNVMSGSVGFTKRTFMRLRGVDPWYRGHGAYADTDFHLTATVGGCQFVDLKLTELHCPHFKMEGQIVLDKMSLRRLALDNFIYYCHKWKLPMILAESQAGACDIVRPVQYVTQKVKEYEHAN